VAAGPAKEDAAAVAERAAFRAELRRRIKADWRPADVYRRVDPAGRLQGSLFSTRVTLRLRPDGSIVSSRLKATSGVPALDKEAMEAIGRTRPPPVPKAMVDDEGGLTVDCELSLDVGMFAFAAKIRAVVAGRWRPSPAFSQTSEQERITLVRMLLSRDGKLLQTEVAQSAGIEFLDRAAREAVPLGTNLPVPPPAFTRQPGPAQVLISFRHKQGVVGILMPREEMQED
jgi:outer membrane biosynthesis protein TonB